MASDSGRIVAHLDRLREDFQALVDLGSGPAAAEHTAAQMEIRLFRELLALGCRLLEVCFTGRAAVRPAEPTAADGTPMTEFHLKSATSLSVFGKIRFKRHRFFGVGQSGISPLDANLSLPRRLLLGQPSGLGGPRGGRRGL